MRRLHRHAARGQWPTDEAVATVTLDYDARHRRRIRLSLDGGGEALLDLDRAVALAAGDGLQLETGEWIAVIAAPEPVLEISAPEPRLRMRLAWHLGNRHVPAEITAERIRPDHVLRDMLEGLGATVSEKVAPFQPERGAYDGAASPPAHAHARRVAHGHGHDHPHGHSHDHPHEHPHDPPHDPEQDDDHDRSAA